MLQLRQKTNNDQENNHDRKHVDEAACMRDAGNDRLAEETEQPVYCQYQDDDQVKQGNLLINNAGTNRRRTRTQSDGSIIMIFRSISMFLSNLIQLLLEMDLRNFGWPFSLICILSGIFSRRLNVLAITASGRLLGHPATCSQKQLPYYW